MYWWQLEPMPSNRKRLRSLIDEELDKLAQLEQFPDFLTKLTATISTFFKDPKSASSWSRTTAENVTTFLMELFVLRIRSGRGIFIAKRPNTSVTESLQRLANCADDCWGQTWFELPCDALYVLRAAEAHTGLKITPRSNSWIFEISIPIREVVMPLIDPAIAIAPILITNSKHARDEMFGSMLRMWRCRNVIGTQTLSGPPCHDEAWRFIERIEACYRPFLEKYNPALAAPRKGFDIPLRKATRESIHEKFVRWNWPEPKVDIAARIEQTLALQRWLTPKGRSHFLPWNSANDDQFLTRKIIADW
jgi:hypothetical protein